MELNKINEHWKLCDRLTVVDAGLLVTGYDPTSFRDNSSYPEGFEPIFLALQSAIISGELSANVLSKDLADKILVGWLYPDKKEIIEMSETDWNASTISAGDLKKWLASKGYKPKFFFTKDDEDILDCDGEFYAPKLAAAVKAWKAVSQDSTLRKSKSPKTAITKWLEKNANELGLISKDGNLNKLAIEQISAIANWNPEGGAPKTE